MTLPNRGVSGPGTNPGSFIETNTRPAGAGTLPGAGLGHGTYEKYPDAINSGDVLVHENQLCTVHSTWVLDIEPETRIVETDRGELRFDREEKVLVALTGDEPSPEDHDDYAGACYYCGNPMAETPDGITHHIHPTGGIDYDQDAEHVAVSDTVMDEMFGSVI